MERKSIIIALLSAAAGLVILLSGGIGYAIGAMQATNIAEQTASQQEEKGLALSDHDITDFLDTFYTFERQGDNYASYKGRLTASMQKQQERALKEISEGTAPQLFGHSRFKESTNYQTHIDDDTVEVLSFVNYVVDLLTSDGQVVTKGIDSHIVVKTQFIKEKESQNYQLNDFETLSTLEEN